MPKSKKISEVSKKPLASLAGGDRLPLGDGTSTAQTTDLDDISQFVVSGNLAADRDIDDLFR